MNDFWRTTGFSHLARHWACHSTLEDYIMVVCISWPCQAARRWGHAHTQKLLGAFSDFTTSVKACLIYNVER
eukprot:6476884-Amphidinium_carterae.2